MKKKYDKNIFFKILSPLIPFIEDAQKNIKGDEKTYKLSLTPFTINLLFGIINRIKSIGLLVTEVKTSPVAKQLDLVIASKSMYNEAFDRYNSQIFRTIFYKLITVLDFMGIPEINNLGHFLLVDGSLFPAFINMEWANYKKNAKAIKLHLSFDLNRMIPVEFLISEGNYSEKKFLSSILKEGSTYICDRGYIGFLLLKEICDKKAFFIIRGKDNLKHIVRESLAVSLPEKFSGLLNDVNDRKIVFTNDVHQMAYRLVAFTAMGETYKIITNRFDLSTYEVIMLYAYRWQVELCFRFLKRTVHGIHLLSHSPNGIEIQFYVFMIAHLLLLAFKQQCAVIDDNNKNAEKERVSDTCYDTHSSINSVTGRQYVCGLVTLLGKGLQKYWKMSLHWLTTVKNLLLEPFTEKTITTIMKC